MSEEIMSEEMLIWIFIVVAVIVGVTFFLTVLDISRSIDSQIEKCNKIKKWANDMLQSRDTE